MAIGDRIEIARKTDIPIETIYTATIGTTFSGDTAPYTQSITLSGIKSSDIPMISPVYDSNVSTALLQKKAWSCIDEIETVDGSILVKCFKKKPATSIPIQIKVVRFNG